MQPAPATNVRRAFAVFIDFFVLFIAWIGFGVVFASGSLYYALGLLFIVDIALTSSHGVSVGRWLAGIRVARLEGGNPNIGAVLLRTVLVFLTGWAGLFVFIVTEWLAHAGAGAVPRRMWWDAAAGTRLVSSKVAPAPGG